MQAGGISQKRERCSSDQARSLREKGGEGRDVFPIYFFSITGERRKKVVSCSLSFQGELRNACLEGESPLLLIRKGGGEGWSAKRKKRRENPSSRAGVVNAPSLSIGLDRSVAGRSQSIGKKEKSTNVHFYYLGWGAKKDRWRDPGKEKRRRQVV